MEKLKQFQPIIIVILICLLIFQFVQINNLNKEIASLHFAVSELDSKFNKIKDKDFDYELGKIKDGLSDNDSRIDDMEQNIEALKKTVRNHEISILDLEGRLLYRSPY